MRPASLFIILATFASTSTARAGDKLEFNRDIRPILAENCFACHGPDSAARKADLRLDIRERAIEAEVLVPAKPEKSKLIERIFAEDTDQVMPPPKSHKKLSTVQKEMLRKWIADGAEYQPHWSLLAVKRPPVPAVKSAGWVRNSIDNFVLADLERHGLKPADEADRRTIARRVSLDLIGLPPKPAEVEAFVNDTAPGAYERYVDRLLDSPHWGEHRGRYWLDAARYADTHGIHFDNFREMWSYRDWVIHALNRNLPFDQFTIEQLAGDLLTKPTLEQRIATGFNRCNITTNEGGAINEEYLVLYTRDRTETASQVWLGMTTGCAVCHDHKFDPLSQKQFYELASFFNNTTQGAMDGNIKDTPPTSVVPKPEDRSRWDALAVELGNLRGQVETRKQTARPDFDKWLGVVKASDLYRSLPQAGLKFHALLSDGGTNSVSVTVGGQAQQVSFEKPLAWGAGHVAAQALKVHPDTLVTVDDVGDYDLDQSFSVAAWVRLPKGGMTGAVVARMDDRDGYRGWDCWIEGNKVGTHIISKWQTDAIKLLSKTALTPNKWHHIALSYDGSRKAAGVKVYIDGVPQGVDVHVDKLTVNTIRTTVPLTIGRRHTAYPLTDMLVQDVRIYQRTLPPPDVAQLAKLTRVAYVASKPAKQQAQPEKDELFAWWLPINDETYQGLVAKVGTLTQEENAIKGRGTIAHVMNEQPKEAMAHILFRGEYDKRKDAVKPSTPEFLPPLPADYPKNRLGLAKWLLLPEHPLTARVTVNRFWQELFGTGLVRTSGDFGVAGELPSHPELLDWLAVEFRESGWDMKQFFKLLVTSATYRQAATTTREKQEKDGQNRLYSRGPRFRMDAEMIRDYALAASGLFVDKLGGPSVKPYQPEGVWEAVAMIGSNTRDYKRDTGENLYRRSMYTFWKRSAPPASLDILNAPNRETCAVRRERTNTPLQALVTLNDPQFVEAARHLAQVTLKDAGPLAAARLDFLAHRALCRPFRPEEVRIVMTTLEDLLDFYADNPEDAKKLITVGESKPDASLDPTTLAAWTMLANQLLNLDEVLSK